MKKVRDIFTNICINYNMIVKCIDNNGYAFTVGKLYDANPLSLQQEELVNVIDSQRFKWIIKNDDGYDQYVKEDLFIDISEIRSRKLEELGI